MVVAAMSFLLISVVWPGPAMQAFAALPERLMSSLQTGRRGLGTARLTKV